MRGHNHFVLFLADQPENVRLITNNPPVHTYLLYENDTVINNAGISGIWIKTVENVGKFVFRCEANNSIHWFGASNNTVLTVNGKVHSFLHNYTAFL